MLRRSAFSDSIFCFSTHKIIPINAREKIPITNQSNDSTVLFIKKTGLHHASNPVSIVYAMKKKSSGQSNRRAPSLITTSYILGNLPNFSL